MPYNRDLIHISKLDEFSTFLTSRGWVLEEPKGAFVVLRARHPKVAEPLVFYKRAHTDHLTCQYGLQATLAEQFIREQRQARSRAKDKHE